MKKDNPIRIFLSLILVLGVPLAAILTVMVGLIFNFSIVQSVPFGLIVLLPVGILGFYLTWHAWNKSSFTIIYQNQSSYIDQVTSKLSTYNIVPVIKEEGRIVYKYWNYFFEFPIELSFNEDKAKLKGSTKILNDLRVISA